mmetsp:Transcript_12373/g.23308  ORF Transcript_12373/g.23308 Transcript_12373/m.23308 type:complete len:205 (+) Transcript_12373:724-1338(+)
MVADKPLAQSILVKSLHVELLARFEQLPINQRCTQSRVEISHQTLVHLKKLERFLSKHEAAIRCYLQQPGQESQGTVISRHGLCLYDVLQSLQGLPRQEEVDRRIPQNHSHLPKHRAFVWLACAPSPVFYTSREPHLFPVLPVVRIEYLHELVKPLLLARPLLYRSVQGPSQSVTRVDSPQLIHTVVQRHQKLRPEAAIGLLIF